MLRKQLTAALIVAMGLGAASSAFAINAVTINASFQGKATPAQLASNLNLGSGSSFAATNGAVTTVRGTVKTREAQTYNGVRVYGRTVVVERDKAGNVLSVSGRAESGLASSLTSVNPRLSGEQAQQALLQAVGWSAGAASKAQSELFVYPGSNGEAARLVYLTSIVILGKGSASRPTAVIDAITGQIIEQWDGLTTGRLPTPGPATNVNVDATGAGGNGATGSYFYDGLSAGHGFLKVQRNGLTCYMQNDNVATYNLAGGTSRGTVWTFGCPTQPYVSSGDTVNGGFSAINDAHHFGGVIHDMYTQWFGAPPLTNPDGSQMRLNLYVHYGSNYGNAFWDGSEMIFGDNDGVSYYPFVVLDVTAHEISHGFTDQHSDLQYTTAQSGGMNESFSDMAGEAAKYFDRGTNDFNLGAEIRNPATLAPGEMSGIRDMCTPSRDGRSIDTATGYRADMDPHYSSGVYNRAFCVLAKTAGWNTRKAFEVFHDANAIAWQANETYNGGACGVVQAATDRGYPAADVTAAFAVVKVACPK